MSLLVHHVIYCFLIEKRVFVFSIIYGTEFCFGIVEGEVSFFGMILHFSDLQFVFLPKWLNLLRFFYIAYN